jgi:hypothetical protein
VATGSFMRDTAAGTATDRRRYPYRHGNNWGMNFSLFVIQFGGSMILIAAILWCGRPGMSIY